MDPIDLKRDHSEMMVDQEASGEEREAREEKEKMSVRSFRPAITSHCCQDSTHLVEETPLLSTRCFSRVFMPFQFAIFSAALPPRLLRSFAARRISDG